MRKRDAQKTMDRQAAEIASLKAQLAVYAPKPAPKVVVTPPKPTPVVKPTIATVPKHPSRKQAKAAAAGKDDAESEIRAARDVERHPIHDADGPLAVMSKEELAAQYGSVGYDDLTSPIDDHDLNWASHPRNKRGTWEAGD